MDGLVLGCANGHRFDASRRGILTTLDGSKGITGDPRELLETRAVFLSRGHYQPVADTVAAALPAAPSLAVLDSGTGTGFYLADVLSRDSTRSALAVDASAAAVAMSVAVTGSPGLVADVWQPSPVRDQRADVILCVFAPRNAAEFARILRDDGALVVVTPGPAHLAQLRSAGLVIGMQAEKRERLDAGLEGHFGLAARHELAYDVELDPETAELLITMGPSGHHDVSGSWPGGRVTVNVDVSTFTKRD